VKGAAARAEAALAMSLGLGLRAKELTSLRWADAYDAEGRVRQVLHLRAAYTKGGRTRDAFLSSPALRRVLARYGVLGAGQVGWAMLLRSKPRLSPRGRSGYPPAADEMLRCSKQPLSAIGLNRSRGMELRRAIRPG